MTKKRIFLIEDDKAIARLLRDNLQYEGFQVEWSDTGVDAVQKARKYSPDLVLLDLMLPDGVDGFNLCRAFAESREHVPVIIITARGQREERVRGLTLGADDYIVKPFALDELLARINAVLRRTHPRLDELTLGSVLIDFRKLKAYRNKREIVFTDLEFQILRHLAEKAGAIVSRDELLNLVWGYSDAPITRTVDNFIFRLRRKIEPDPHHPRFIRTAYGDGYRLTPNETDN